MESDDLAEGRPSSVFVFNPFAEGYIAKGKAFAPVKHQALLASDLANLPQFLCEPDDIVLVGKRPTTDFLNSLRQAGFSVPEFVELREGRIDPAGGLCQRKVGNLRPWAWGPDSVKLLEPLFARMRGEVQSASGYFNDRTARLYSKAWSASFLTKVLAHCRDALGQRWLCSQQETGVAVATLEDALQAVAAIRGHGHHRVIVKEALGLAGHNAIRLWEPEVLPAQQKWLAQALSNGGQLIVETWLERELDFSVQLEMGPSKLKLCGYTGLVNDRRGQYQANSAEANYRECLPPNVAGLFSSVADISNCLRDLYVEIFSLLEAELADTGFVGPISIDAFVYRTPQGEFRLKPVVEINPRYTMGRLTVELMKHTFPGSCGLFRLVNRAQARAEGFGDFAGYGRSLRERFPLRLEGNPARKIREGALCLNDPGEAQVSLATFEVRPVVDPG